jgi:hypothetical protein
MPKTINIQLTDSEVESLKNAISYLKITEEGHYEECLDDEGCDTPESDNHIYKDVVVLEAVLRRAGIEY